MTAPGFYMALSYIIGAFVGIIMAYMTFLQLNGFVALLSSMLVFLIVMWVLGFGGSVLYLICRNK